MSTLFKKPKSAKKTIVHFRRGIFVDPTYGACYQVQLLTDGMPEEWRKQSRTRFHTLSKAERLARAYNCRLVEEAWPMNLDLSGDIEPGTVALVKDSWADPLCLFVCTGGFGLKAGAMGTGIFGHWLSEVGTRDPETPKLHISDLVRKASVEEIELAKRYQTQPEKFKWIANQRCLHRQVMDTIEEFYDRPEKFSKDDLKEALALLCRRYSGLSTLSWARFDALADAVFAPNATTEVHD